MEKRQVTMHDGRYLIFYTFEDMPAPSEDGAENDDGKAAERQPEAKPEAEEERRV